VSGDRRYRTERWQKLRKFERAVVQRRLAEDEPPQDMDAPEL
jgi:hypothetical protein